MKAVKNKLLALVMMLTLLLAVAGCAGQQTQKQEEAQQEPQKQEQQVEAKTLTLATTTSTQDSGLLDVLVPEFEKQNNVKVKVIAVGTGAAIKMGETGDADVILVHARAAEDKFVADGYGVNRKDVMHNDFVLVGPSSDPAGIKGKSIDEALKELAQGKAPFISRGDDSGTHKKEQSLWEKAGIKPQGDWYVEAGSGMGDTLKMAAEKQGYTLADRGTYLAMKQDVALEIIIEKDGPLLNPYGVIAVNPEKHPDVHYEEAMKFVDFMVAPATQEIIKNFGVDKYGEPLFIPDAK